MHVRLEVSQAYVNPQPGHLWDAANHSASAIRLASAVRTASAADITSHSRASVRMSGRWLRIDWTTIHRAETSSGIASSIASLSSVTRHSESGVEACRESFCANGTTTRAANMFAVLRASSRDWNSCGVMGNSNAHDPARPKDRPTDLGPTCRRGCGYSGRRCSGCWWTGTPPLTMTLGTSWPNGWESRTS